MSRSVATLRAPTTRYTFGVKWRGRCQFCRLGRSFALLLLLLLLTVASTAVVVVVVAVARCCRRCAFRLLATDRQPHRLHLRTNERSDGHKLAGYRDRKLEAAHARNGGEQGHSAS